MDTSERKESCDGDQRYGFSSVNPCRKRERGDSVIRSGAERAAQVVKKKLLGRPRLKCFGTNVDVSNDGGGPI